MSDLLNIAREEIFRGTRLDQQHTLISLDTADALCNRIEELKQEKQSWWDAQVLSEKVGVALIKQLEARIEELKKENRDMRITLAQKRSMMED